MNKTEIRAVDGDRDSADLKSFLVPSDAARLDLCGRAVADNDAIIIVAEQDGHAIGFAVVHLRARNDMGWHEEGGTLAWLKAGDGYLENIEVRDGFRGKGIGSDLMRRVEQELRERGIVRIWCHTGEKNTSAQRFYERQGWRLIRTLQVPWQPQGKLSRIYCRELRRAQKDVVEA